MTSISLTDLHLDLDEKRAVLAAIERVMDRGWFVQGPEVDAFEADLASSLGAEQSVGVGSGTDALILGMRSLGIGPGDEVVVPGFTAFPTVAAVLETGATPVLADVDPDRPTLSLESALSAVTSRTRAVILVHLYGLAADAPGFAQQLQPHGVHLIEDCAQAQGSILPSGQHAGTVGSFGAFSFYPTKVVGALGDGGALVSADMDLATAVRGWRSHGELGQRYLHELPARNSRLDDLQAAVLRVRLARLEDRLRRLRAISARYADGLEGLVDYVRHGPLDAPHLAVARLQLPSSVDQVAATLAAEGIQTGRHYPLPLEDQPALQGVVRRTPNPNSRRWAASCLSLPIHEHLTDTDVDRVIDATAAAIDLRDE